MNDIRGGRVTCYLDDIRVLRSFGEGQVCRTTAGAISGQQDDANTPVAHFDTCRAHSSPAS